MNSFWHKGNRVLLLENGDEFFPRVFVTISEARHEVFIETFILGDDKVGRELRQVLIDACGRGVTVSILVDGFGSPGLDGEFIDGLTAAGAKFHIFNQSTTLLGVRTNLFRRMHRKLVVVDRRIAYVGGINFAEDQVTDFGPLAKQDYAIEIEGSAAAEIRDFANHAVTTPHRSWPMRAYHRFRQRHQFRQRSLPKEDANNVESGAHVLFVTRDNYRHRTSIEHYYQLATRGAQRELIIANAYFFPGYRLLRGLRNAAKRQVKVMLILQGHPDIPIVKWGARLLYEYLLSAGVQIYEYDERPLHGKVAVVDDSWATVGSSNLDPLSLSLNLEANVMIHDQHFNSELRNRLMHLINHHCERIELAAIPEHNWWRGMVSAAAFHLLRHIPNWTELLPKHSITLKKMEPPNAKAAAQSHLNAGR